MFGKRYFSCSYFTGKYFPPVCKEGASYPIRQERYLASLGGLGTQLLRDDNEIIELIYSLFGCRRIF